MAAVKESQKSPRVISASSSDCDSPANTWSDDEAEPTLGDFWDSFSAAVADKMAQDKSNKGKGPEL